MRVVCLANNFVGEKVVSWLKKQKKSEIVALVLHPPGKQRYVEEIILESQLPENRVFFADTLDNDTTLMEIQKLKPDIAVSVYFGYILKQKFIELFPGGCINLHPAYLPYNRGANPNIWSIVDGTPAGSTLHYVNEKIDMGDIIAQKQVRVAMTDTGFSLYEKLEKASISLFKDTWPEIEAGRIHPVHQNPDEGTYHKLADISKIDEIDLDRMYKARDLINIIRARTFPPYNGAYVLDNGEKTYLNIQFKTEDKFQ